MMEMGMEMEYVRYERIYEVNEIHEDFDSVYSPIEPDRDIDMMLIKVEKNGKKYMLSAEDGCVIRHIFPSKEIDRLKNADLIVEGRICPDNLAALKDEKRKEKIFNEIHKEKRRDVKKS